MGLIYIYIYNFSGIAAEAGIRCFNGLGNSCSQE